MAGPFLYFERSHSCNQNLLQVACRGTGYGELLSPPETNQFWLQADLLLEGAYILLDLKAGLTLCILSSRDISLFFKVVLGSQPWVQNMGLVPLPWRPEPVKWSGAGGKIRLGVMWNDGVVLPQPPVRRALKAMVEALKNTNKFEIVDYEPMYHKDLILMAVGDILYYKFVS